jgi:hypothetical protein
MLIIATHICFTILSFDALQFSSLKIMLLGPALEGSLRLHLLVL